jgi:hypothetical protein
LIIRVFILTCVYYFLESIQFEHLSPRIALGSPNQHSYITNVNFPAETPANLVFLTTVTCPSSHNVRVAVPLALEALVKTCEQNYLEIEDPYKKPRKTWRFCHFSDDADDASSSNDESIIYIQSYLSILNLREVTGPSKKSGLSFKLRLESVRDEDTELKVQQIEKQVNRTRGLKGGALQQSLSLAAKENISLMPSCDENLCFNGGRCDPASGACVCAGHFVGRHCLQTICGARRMPCRNGGKCRLTKQSFVCDCPIGFEGEKCESRKWPCGRNPCGIHGICEAATNNDDGFRCKCHLWWKGE